MALAGQSTSLLVIRRGGNPHHLSPGKTQSLCEADLGAIDHRTPSSFCPKGRLPSHCASSLSHTLVSVIESLTSRLTFFKDWAIQHSGLSPPPRGLVITCAMAAIPAPAGECPHLSSPESNHHLICSRAFPCTTSHRTPPAGQSTGALTVASQGDCKATLQASTELCPNSNPFTPREWLFCHRQASSRLAAELTQRPHPSIGGFKGCLPTGVITPSPPGVWLGKAHQY